MSDSQQHILLITTDQQRFDTIAAAGNPHIITPHMDWLCDRGIHYTRCYADAPICGPSRHTILTGKHAYNQQENFSAWNITPIDPATTLPGILTANGYQTRAQGKMHFYDERCTFGYEQMEILEDYYREMRRYNRPMPMDTGLGQNELVPSIGTVHENESITRWTAARSCDFLDTRDHNRPFFMHTSFSKPHPPFDPPANYWSLYANRDVQDIMTGDWSTTPDDVPSGLRMNTWELNCIDRMSRDTIRDAKRAYYALITHIDYTLGHIFARLRELDILDNTTVIFTSDHGEMFCDHHLGGKTIHLEGSAHVPMIVMPAQGMIDENLRGTTCDTLCSLADILPTALGAAGVECPTDRDGVDLLAIARGEQNGRETLHGESYQSHMVREGDYKLIFNSAGGGELLFNISEDPYEQKELIRAGNHSQVHQNLRQKMIDRLTKYDHPAVKDGDLFPGPAPDEQSIRGRWPGYHSLVKPNDVCH